jgi:hypothetical protein
MHHELKIEIPFYEAVVSGDKTFEIRYNDRGFQKGDTILLRPYRGASFDSTRPDIKAMITYLTNYNQKDGWCVFAFEVNK